MLYNDSVSVNKEYNIKENSCVTRKRDLTGRIRQSGLIESRKTKVEFVVEGFVDEETKSEVTLV